MPHDFVTNKSSLIDKIGIVLISLFLITLTLSAYNLNSLCIICLVICTLLKGNISNGFIVAWKAPFFRACALLFFIILTGLLYTTNLKESLRIDQMWLSLIAIPWILCSEKLAKSMQWEKIMVIFCGFLFLASFYCLSVSTYRSLITNDIQQLFYHNLVSPISQHAIYFSLLVVVAILFLIEQREKVSSSRKRNSCTTFLMYFIFFLILLSSKLILSVILVYFLYKAVSSRKKHTKLSLFIILTIVISAFTLFYTENPVKKRFQDILKIRTTKITTNDQQKGDFNGLEFRIIQWRLVKEILQEKQRWLIGVSTGDVQEELDNKYKEYNFYRGDPATGDMGFLGYNAHNQFLQCLLQSGIAGLLAFLYLCYTMIKMAIKARLTDLWVLTLLFLTFFFTESVLHNHKGIVSVTFFPLFLYYSKWSRSNYKLSSA